MLHPVVHTSMTITVSRMNIMFIYLKSLPSRPPARLFTIPPPKARVAYVEAWLNRSHREKATVLVIVKTRAIARVTLASKKYLTPNPSEGNGNTHPLN